MRIFLIVKLRIKIMMRVRLRRTPVKIETIRGRENRDLEFKISPLKKNISIHLGPKSKKATLHI